MKFGVTVHTVICNEENWVWFALSSVKDMVDQVLVFDTGSTDRTLDAIRDIQDPKIVIEERGAVSPRELVRLRQEQIDRTKTSWILLLDGDEVWDTRSFHLLLRVLEQAPGEKWGAVVGAIPCVGDIYHRMPEQYGRYRIGEKRGYINLRAIRNLPGLRVDGLYPNEAYSTSNKVPLQDQPQCLLFPDVSYWHLTHLKRSSKDPMVIGNRKRVYDFGIPIPKGTTVPEAFSKQHPAWIPSPWERRSFPFLCFASLHSPLRRLL